MSGRSFEIFDGVLATLLTLRYCICYVFVGLSVIWIMLKSGIKVKRLNLVLIICIMSEQAQNKRCTKNSSFIHSECFV